MARCELSIHLDGEQTRFRGGDTVTGTVEVRTDTEVQCKGLTVECQWRTHGKGNTARGQAQRLDLFQGTWRPGTVRRYAFSFDLPHGPFTYNGHYLNVGWFILARADIPWAIDPKTEHEIAVEPDPTAEPQWLNLVQSAADLPEALRTQVQGPNAPAQVPASVRRISSSLGIGCLVIMALPLLALVAVAVYQGIALARGEADLIEALLWIGVTLIFVAAIAKGPLKLLRNRWARKRLGDIGFDVTPLTLRRGESVTVRFSCHPRQSTPLNRASVRIEAEERVTRGSGTNRGTYRQQVYRHEEDLPVQQGVPAGLPFQRQLEIRIPADAPPSFIAADNRLDWTVSLHLDIPRGPDWSGERAILVHP
jgi:hypothetical protein